MHCWWYLAHLRWIRILLLWKTAGQDIVVVTSVLHCKNHVIPSTAICIPVTVPVIRSCDAPKRRWRIFWQLGCVLFVEMAAYRVEARSGSAVKADDLAAGHREWEGCPLLGAKRPVLGAVALKGKWSYDNWSSHCTIAATDRCENFLRVIKFHLLETYTFLMVALL